MAQDKLYLLAKALDLSSCKVLDGSLLQTFLGVCVAGLGTDATNYMCSALNVLGHMVLLFETYKAHRAGEKAALRSITQVACRV